MQYGNKLGENVSIEYKKKFKSYYVVWKLRSKMKTNIVSGEFKSYYVVWKRDCFDGWSEQDEEFKSYYVVWKLG